MTRLYPIGLSFLIGVMLIAVTAIPFNPLHSYLAFVVATALIILAHPSPAPALSFWRRLIARTVEPVPKPI